MTPTTIRKLCEEAIVHEASMPELWTSEDDGSLWGTVKSGEHEGTSEEIAEFQHEVVQDALIKQQDREPLLARALLAALECIDRLRTEDIGADDAHIRDFDAALERLGGG